MTQVTCTLAARNQDQLRNPMLGNRVWATFTFFKINLKSAVYLISFGAVVHIPRPYTHSSLHLGLADISCRRTCSICTACFVVWRPRRAADTSTNRPQDFLCRRNASMEHAADTAEAAAVDHYFSSSTENILLGNRLMIVL